jgi:hypothetical protein
MSTSKKLILITIILSGMVLYISSQKTNNPEQVPQQAGNVATTTSLNTSEWLTYESKEYGFRFKYPKELEVRDGKDSNEIAYSGAFIVLPGIYLNIKNPRRGEVGESDNYMIEIMQIATSTSTFWQQFSESALNEIRSNDIQSNILHKDQYGRITNISVYGKNYTYYTIELRGFEPKFTEGFMSEIKDPYLIESMQKYPEFLKILEGIYSTFEIIQ